MELGEERWGFSVLQGQAAVFAPQPTTLNNPRLYILEAPKQSLGIRDIALRAGSRIFREASDRRELALGKLAGGLCASRDWVKGSFL